MRMLRSSIGTLLLIPWVFINYVGAIRSDLYLNKDKFGEFLRMEISEKGCTNVPLNWDNQAISLDTHGSCVKFYDLPYCRGKYVAIQPYHGTFQDNLDTLGFKQIISSASPCGPKVPTGRYYILNGADGSVLTIDKRNGSIVARTLPFKPYILKNQQFQVDKISLADYEIIPRVHEDLNPVTYDMSISTKSYPVKRSWKIESVYRGKYIIKNEWNSRCLYKSESGKVEEHECVAWSPNQEWMFKAIKVQPFFPSKAQLTNKPIRPDENLPFQPQQDVFPQFHVPRPNLRPGQPLRNPNKKKKPQPQDDTSRPTLPIINRPFERPNPIVINPGEPFPPVQPVPIYPQSSLRLPPIIGIGPDGKPDPNRPSIPHVVHPGRLPFPADPVVTNPKKSVWPPTLYGHFGQWTTPRPAPALPPKKKNSDEEDEEEEEKEEDDDKEEKEDDDKEEIEEEDSNNVDNQEEKDDDDNNVDQQEEKDDDDSNNVDQQEERDDDKDVEEPEEENSKEKDEKEDRRGHQESLEDDDDDSGEDEESEERKK